MSRPTVLYIVAITLAACAPTSSDPTLSPADSPEAGTSAPAEAVVELDNAAAQIAAAVAAAPSDRREGAAVRGYDADGKLVLLREGTNDLVCMADKPDDERFQVACYHASLEPYMRRGRELRAEGVSGPDSFEARHAEIEAGTLAMPREPTMVYTLGGVASMHDPATGAVDEAYGRRVHAIYTPYATEESTGLSTTPDQQGAPWIMRAGTPTAHIMVVLEPLETAKEDAG